VERQLRAMVDSACLGVISVTTVTLAALAPFYDDATIQSAAARRTFLLQRRPAAG
jgi:hypothetical protein